MPCIVFLQSSNELCNIFFFQGPNTPRHLAILQSSRACFQESSAPQIAQMLLGAIFLWCKRSPDGSVCRASLHRNTLILDGT